MNFTYFNRLAGALSVLHWQVQPRPTTEGALAYATEGALAYATERAQVQNISVSDAISRNFAERMQGQFICLATALAVLGGLCLLIGYELVPAWAEVVLSFLPMALLVGLALLGRSIPAGVR